MGIFFKPQIAANWNATLHPIGACPSRGLAQNALLLPAPHQPSAPDASMSSSFRAGTLFTPLDQLFTIGHPTLESMAKALLAQESPKHRTPQLAELTLEAGSLQSTGSPSSSGLRAAEADEPANVMPPNEELYQKLGTFMQDLYEQLVENDAVFRFNDGRPVPYREMRNVDKVRVLFDLMIRRRREEVTYDLTGTQSRIVVLNTEGQPIHLSAPMIEGEEELLYLKFAATGLLQMIPPLPVSDHERWSDTEPLMINGIDIDIGQVSRMLQVSPKTARTILQNHERFVLITYGHPFFAESDHIPFAFNLGVRFIVPDMPPEERQVVNALLPFLQGISGGKQAALSLERALASIQRKDLRDAFEGLARELMEDPQSDIGRHADGSFTEKYLHLLTWHLAFALPAELDMMEGPVEPAEIRYQPWEVWKHLTGVDDDYEALRRHYVNFVIYPDMREWLPFMHADEEIIRGVHSLLEAEESPLHGALLERAHPDAQELYLRVKALDRMHAAMDALFEEE